MVFALSSAVRGDAIELISPNEETAGRFGFALSGVPDVNGDNLADLVVGAYNENPGVSPSNSGRAYIFSGPTGAALFTLASPNQEIDGRFGYSVSGVPDVDGDGRGDVVVGANLEDPGLSPNNAGRAYIFSGASGALLHTLVSPAETANGEFGYSVAGLSDINNDGHGDVIVGAFGENSAPGASGNAHVFSGATGTLLFTLTSPNAEANGRFGESVSAVPDANGDGKADIIVGAWYEDPGASPDSAGRAYLFSGAGGTLLNTFSSPSEEIGGLFGTSVSGITDLNHDGRGDVIIGAPFEDPGASPTDAGRAYVYSGSDGTLLFTLSSTNSEAPDGYFGYSVSSAADVEGDGIADVVVGAPYEDPGASPQNAGRGYIFSGASGAKIRELVSPDASSGGGFGWPIAGTNDLNGDAKGDVVVGASSQEPDRAYIFDPCYVSRFYVRANATGANNGSSWADAFTHLQDALRACAQSGSEIWVAAGTYMPDGGRIAPGGSFVAGNGIRSETFNLPAGVAVYGGFAGTETELNQRSSQNVTILSGDLNADDGPDFANYDDNSFHVVTASGVDATAVLDLFTVVGGNASGAGAAGTGGGLYAHSGSPTIRNCVFTLNTAVSGGGLSFEGFSEPLLDSNQISLNAATSDAAGVKVRGNPGGPYAVPVFLHCIFSGNTAAASPSGSGGGLSLRACNAKVQYCLFQDNLAARGAGAIVSTEGTMSFFGSNFLRNIASGPSGFCRGGGLWITNISNTVVQNCVFQGNRATNGVDGLGGGLAVSNDANSARLSNLIFAGNVADSGGALSTANTGTDLRNITAASNVALQTGGGYHLAATSANASPANCILWGNSDSSGFGSTSQIAVVGPSTTASHCIIQGGFSGVAIVNANPAFRVDPSPGLDGQWDGVDDQYGDLGLLATSPAIDAGNNASAPADLLDLNDNGNTTEPIGFDVGLRPRFRESQSVPNTGAGTAPLVDIGAFEHIGSQVLVSPNPAATAWPDSVETNSLQAALAFARAYAGEVSEIWVAGGTYKPDIGVGITPGDRTASFQMIHGVNIYGGFAGNESQLSQRNAAVNESILSGDLLGNDDANFTNYGDNSYHVVTANTAGPGFTYLDSVIIRGGKGEGTALTTNRLGGGVYINGMNLYVVGCKLIENQAVFGGGLYATGACTPQVVGCIVEKNNATDDGGGLYFTGATCTPSVINSDFSVNSATDGGGALVSQASPVRVGSTCTFVSNSAARGGAVYFSGLPNSIIDAALFEHNTATGTGGGAIICLNVSPGFYNCRFLGNDANGSGTGGAVFSNSGAPIFANSIFTGNEAGGGGGALSLNNGSPTIANCTIAGNRVATNPGGALRLENSNANLSNSIIHDNPSSGAMIQLLNSSAPIVSYSLVQGGWAGGTGNVDADPVFIQKPTPGPDGGWNAVGDDYGDLHVYYFSPVIDAGNAAALPADLADVDGDLNTAEAIPLDIDGQTRRVEDLSMTNGPAAGAPPVDIGAFEFIPPVATTAIVRVKSNATGADNGTSWTNGYTDLQRALCAAVNSNGLTDEVWVASGTYKPGRPGDPRTVMFRLFDDLPLFGHFMGTETHLSQRNLNNPAAETILSGDLNGDDQPFDPYQSPSHVGYDENPYHILVSALADSVPIVDGFTIRGGHANGPGSDVSGAGINVPLGSLTVRNCVFREHYSTNAGAAIAHYPSSESSLLVDHCIFEQNRATNNGGPGILSTDQSALEIRHSGFRRNVTDGGVVSASATPPAYIADCLFEENVGSGLSLRIGTRTVVRCDFVRNIANLGAGLYLYISPGAEADLVNCRFFGNHAIGSGTDPNFGGGAIYSRSTSPDGNNLIATNCLFVGNKGVRGGAVMLANHDVGGGSATFTNCSFAHNETDGDGGGIWVGTVPLTPTGTSSFTARNCIFWRNADAGGIDSSAQIHVANGGSATADFNVIDGGWPFAGAGNVNTNPVFSSDPADGPDNEWGTEDDDYGDLRLGAGSPAIDRGRNSLIAMDNADLDCDGNTLEPIPFDLNGAPRRVDDAMTADCAGQNPGVCGAAPIVDIGAYETGPIVGDQIFVNASAPGPVHDGTSWATAYRHIQDALNYTGTLGCGAIEIWVARGTYMPDGGFTPVSGGHVNGTLDREATFQLQMSVVLYGGLAGTEDPDTFDLATRNLAANPTVLSGDLLGNDNPGSTADNAYHVATGTGTTDIAILDGFTITGGAADQPPSGGGFITLSEGPVLRNCIITGNSGECAGGFDSIGGHITIENLVSAANTSSNGHGVGLTSSRIDLIGDWSMNDGRIDVFGTTFDGPGAILLGPSALMQVRSLAPCDADVITRVQGTMGATTVFLPATGGPDPIPARWEIAGAALSDVSLLGASTQVYIAPSAIAGSSATLTWTGNYLEQDLSSGGWADATFHWGGTLTITGDLYDGPNPGATLLNPGEPVLLIASVGSFRVRETAAGSNILMFEEPPTFAPTGGFLVANASGFILAGEQELSLDFSSALEGGQFPLSSFNGSTFVSLISTSTFTQQPIELPQQTTTTYSDIRGTGNLFIDPGARLVVAGTAVLNLSGLPDEVCATQEPGSPGGGMVTVLGQLHVQDSGRVHNTDVAVNLAEVGTESELVHNNILLSESAPGFGGEFFAADDATISCNVITSEGDRYLDLDPDPDDGESPNIYGNKFYVIIKQGSGGEQGELLELRSPDLDPGAGGGLSGAIALGSSAGYDDTWALERLEILEDAKVNLTNRPGFVFQEPQISTPEAVYVRELRLHPGATLNTGLQRLYYQSVVDESGAPLGSPDQNGIFANGAKLVDYPLLGFSLKVIEMEDETEFAVRVRPRLRDTSDDDNQPSLPPFLEGEIAREPFAVTGHPSNHAMRMALRKSDCPPSAPPCPAATSVAAHGAFARAGEDQIVVAFKYKFCGSAIDELWVYLSDSPEVSTGLGSPIAVLTPPLTGPGSVASNEFAEFSGLFARDSMHNFRRGTYVELELRGAADACVIIDDWDPLACGSPECGDYDLSYYVSKVDLLYALTAVGQSVGTTNSCLDKASRDNYVDMTDVVLSDGLYGYGVSGLCTNSATTSFVGPPFAVTLPEEKLVIAGKSNSAGDHGDKLYPVTATIAVSDAGVAPAVPAGNPAYGPRGHGRLIADGDGELYQLHSAAGLVRLSDGAVMIEPGEQVVGSSTVRVGLSSAGPGLPILDAAFDPHDSTVVYVVPVRVIPPEGPSHAYSAAARLQLTDTSGTGDFTWSIASMTNVFGYDPWLDPNNNTSPPEYSQTNVQYLREIEVDDAGHVFVTAARSDNANDWLLIYQAAIGNASEQRIRLSDSPTVLRGPTAMKVTSDGDRLFLGTSLDDGDATTTTIREFLLSGSGAVSVTLGRLITVNNMRFTSAIAEDPDSGDLWAVGFTLPYFDPLDPPPQFGENDSLSATATLAKILSAGTAFTATTLTGSDASLPVSAAFFVPGCRLGDVNDSGAANTADIAPFVNVLMNGTADPEQLCRSDMNTDGMLNAKDIQPFVTLLLGGG